jgi:hypothetical protein
VTRIFTFHAFDPIIIDLDRVVAIRPFDRSYSGQGSGTTFTFDYGASLDARGVPLKDAQVAWETGSHGGSVNTMRWVPLEES